MEMDGEGDGSKIIPKQEPAEPVKYNDVTHLSVLILGLRDVGVEVARKLIEGGVRNLTFYDDSKVEAESASHLLPQSQFQPDLTQNNNVHQAINSWTNLYPEVKVTDRRTNTGVQWDALKEHHVVVLTECNWKVLQYCRRNGISVVTTQTNGHFGRVLFDFVDPPPTTPPSFPLDPSSASHESTKTVAGVGAGNVTGEKNEFLDKISLRLFEQFDGNRPAFAECSASKSNFVPTIHAAYTAFNRFKKKNLSNSAVLNYETFRRHVDDWEPSQSKMEGRLLDEFYDHLDRRIPLVNKYIGSVGAQEILKFWNEKSLPVHQLLILYGGDFRFPISFSKVSCDSNVDGRGQESSEDLDFASPQIKQITGPSKNVENMQSVTNSDQDQNMEPEALQPLAPEPEPEPKPEPEPEPSEPELPQASCWPFAKSRKHKNSFNKNGKRSNKITKHEVKHVYHQYQTPQLPPPIDPSSVHQLYGWNGGIQLRSNSCYMDSTLFSMFCCTSAFDEAVLSPRGGESPFAECVKRMLRGIVTRLREDKFVSGDVVMKFRETLVTEGNFTRKLLGTFMDPEEFFYILFNKALDLPRFFTYNTGHGDFAHQIFLPRSQGRPVATVQDLFEASMRYNGDLKLARMPHPALIILMPRSNGSLVGYQKIIPNLQLDLTGVMTEPKSKRCLCGEDVATIVCSLCPSDLDSVVTYCQLCESQGKFLQSDEGAGSRNLGNPTHEFSPRPILVPLAQNFKMKLVAVVCVAGFHYTSFVRCGEEWIYFDSMGPSVSRVQNCRTIISEAEINVTKNQFYSKSWEYYGASLTDRIFRDCQYCIYEPEDQVLQKKN